MDTLSPYGGLDASPEVDEPQRHTRSDRTRHGAPLLLRAMGLVVAVAFAFPGLYLVWRNFTEDADPAGLLFSARTLEPLSRTLILAVSVSLTSSVIGTVLAWLSTRTDLLGARAWRTILPLPLVFPTFIGAAALIRTFNPGGLASEALTGLGLPEPPELRGFFGAWYVLTLFTYPYVYLPVAAGFRQLPGSLEDNARVLGDTPLRVFLRICLPQVRASITAGTLLVFLYTVSDYGAVVLLRYDTLTRAIATNQFGNRPVALALSLILLVLAATVVAMERLISQRATVVGTNRSSRPVQYSLGRWRVPATIGVGMAALAGVGGPLVALVDWAGGGVSRYLGNGRRLTIDEGDVIESTAATLQVSILAAIFALIAVLPVAFLVGRFRSRTGSVAHGVVIASFALPGLLIALSMRFWSLQAPPAFDAVRGSMAVLIFAYVVRFGSLAMGVTLVAVRAVPAGLGDAAASLGAGRLRRFLSIDLPLMAPGLAAAAGLVLLSVMKELPISELVSPLGYANLSTRIFSSFRDAFVAEAGILAVVLVALSFALSWFLVIRRADHLS